jgi:hypothetical protein
MKTERDIQRYSLIPPIKRASGYYLYDYRGNRYIDCFQDGGHSVLGYRDKRVSVAVKDVLSKGLVAELPSVYGQRVVKALAILFPNFRGVIIDSSMERALTRYAIVAGKKIEDCVPDRIADPLFPRESDPDAIITYWRPFLDCSLAEFDAIVPVLPFSVCGAPAVVCIRESSGLVAPVAVAPFVLAGAVRSLYNLQRHDIPRWCVEFIPGSGKIWKKNGMYIIPSMDEDTYDSVWKRFLDDRIILSPELVKPSILPQEISPGELARLKSAFETFAD